MDIFDSLLNKSLHLEGDTVPMRWRFYLLFLVNTLNRDHCVFDGRSIVFVVCVKFFTFLASSKPLHRFVSHLICDGCSLSVALPSL